MKKKYEAPTAEKLEFDYTDTVVASGGTYTLYVDGFFGCRERPTSDPWNVTSLPTCM